MMTRILGAVFFVLAVLMLGPAGSAQDNCPCQPQAANQCATQCRTAYASCQARIDALKYRSKEEAARVNAGLYHKCSVTLASCRKGCSNCPCRTPSAQSQRCVLQCRTAYASCQARIDALKYRSKEEAARVNAGLYHKCSVTLDSCRTGCGAQ